MIIDTNDMRYYEFSDNEIKIVLQVLDIIKREKLKEYEHNINNDISNVEYWNKERKE